MENFVQKPGFSRKNPHIGNMAPSAITKLSLFAG